MRILVAEDEKHLNRIISEALSDEGYSVDSCFNGQEVLEHMACAEYDVLVLDIMMPRMDGLEVVRRLRGEGNATPVLFLTSRDSIEDKVTGLESGGDYYLTKPFAFPELLAVVRAMARKYTGNRSNIYTVADAGQRRPHRHPGGTGHQADRQGIRPAGVHGAQQGRGAVPGDDRKQPLELRLRGRHQRGGRVCGLPAQEGGRRSGKEADPHRLGHRVGTEGGVTCLQSCD